MWLFQWNLECGEDRRFPIFFILSAEYTACHRLAAAGAKSRKSASGDPRRTPNFFREGSAMKTRHWLALVLGLLAALTPAVEAAPPGEAPAEWTISGPFTHQNLAVFLIHGKEVIPGKK